MALPSGSASLPDDEARFLAIGPQLVKLLDEYDRLWAPSHAAYEAWWKAGRHLAQWEVREALPEWKVYCDVRQPADELNEVLKTKIKLITGYLGTKETIMAIENGEAHGRCSVAWSCSFFTC